jgi:hypothetical protein
MDALPSRFALAGDDNIVFSRANSQPVVFPEPGDEARDAFGERG